MKTLKKTAAMVVTVVAVFLFSVTTTAAATATTGVTTVAATEVKSRCVTINGVFEGVIFSLPHCGPIGTVVVYKLEKKGHKNIYMIAIERLSLREYRWKGGIQMEKKQGGEIII